MIPIALSQEMRRFFSEMLIKVAHANITLADEPDLLTVQDILSVDAFPESNGLLLSQRFGLITLAVNNIYKKATGVGYHDAFMWTPTPNVVIKSNKHGVLELVIKEAQQEILSWGEEFPLFPAQRWDDLILNRWNFEERVDINYKVSDSKFHHRPDNTFLLPWGRGEKLFDQTPKITFSFPAVRRQWSLFSEYIERTDDYPLRALRNVAESVGINPERFEIRKGYISGIGGKTFVCAIVGPDAAILQRFKEQYYSMSKYESLLAGTDLTEVYQHALQIIGRVSASRNNHHLANYIAHEAYSYVIWRLGEKPIQNLQYADISIPMSERSFDAKPKIVLGETLYSSESMIDSAPYDLGLNDKLALILLAVKGWARELNIDAEHVWIEHGLATVESKKKLVYAVVCLNGSVLEKIQEPTYLFQCAYQNS